MLCFSRKPTFERDLHPRHVPPQAPEIQFRRIGYEEPFIIIRSDPSDESIPLRSPEPIAALAETVRLRSRIWRQIENTAGNVVVSGVGHLALHRHGEPTTLMALRVAWRAS